MENRKRKKEKTFVSQYIPAIKQGTPLIETLSNGLGQPVAKAPATRQRNEQRMLIPQDWDDRTIVAPANIAVMHHSDSVPIGLVIVHVEQRYILHQILSKLVDKLALCALHLTKETRAFIMLGYKILTISALSLQVRKEDKFVIPSTQYENTH